MLSVVLSTAFAATPPALDAPVATGMRSKKDVGVVIGVEDFETLPDAIGARADAGSVAAWLLGGRGLDPKRLTVVEDATAASARTAVRRAAKDVKRNATLWIYWSGHGAWADGQRVLLGKDATAEAPADAGVPLAELVGLAEDSKAGKVVIVVDAGFGGLGRDGEVLFPPPDSVGPLPSRTDARITVWSGTTAGEPAYRYPANDRGIFSYFVVGALRGWADGQIGTAADNVVTLQEAQGYVTRVVRQMGGGEQKPGKDTRADVNAWALTTGTLEAGPSKEDLAALALAEKARRVRKAEEKLLVVAKAEWDALAATTAVASPEADAALKAFLTKYDAATVPVDGAQVAVAVPYVAEARARLDAFARAAAKVTKKRGKKKKRTSAKTPPPPPVATAACMDLLPLEPKAITGELTPDLVACLESRIAEEPLLTAKDKLSRMLLVHADARSDTVEWTRLAARHLEDFDRSDPDLCLKFALVLSRGPIEDAELVLKWSDYALENKHVWDGATYMARVYTLYRLKAETATRLWHDAEDDFIEERKEEDELVAEEYRGLAKDLAREWLDYARLSAQPFDRAFVLCESASGNVAFCKGG